VKGSVNLDEAIDRGLVVDLDRLAVVLARQKPAWEPGTRQAYHAITLGFYRDEQLRRVYPQLRSLGQFSRTRSPRRSGWTSTSGCRSDPELATGRHCAAQPDQDAARLREIHNRVG
jgi:hypothetical protein